MSRERGVIKLGKFSAAHAAADRFDDPIGQEMGHLGQVMDALVAEYGEHGDVSDLFLHQIRNHVERLTMFEKIKTAEAVISEQAVAVGALVQMLGADRQPGAAERVRMAGVVLVAGLVELDAFNGEGA